MTPLVVIGCGGFGREVWSIANAINAQAPTFELLGMIDDALSEPNAEALERIGAPYLGTSQWLESAPEGVHAVIGIGSAGARRAIDARWAELSWATLVHPDTTIGADVVLAPGVVVAPGARLSTSIRVGRHAHIDQGVTVGHDSVLDDYTRANPQACVSGSVTVSAGATLGANCTVLQGLTIGENVMVGAGAVVVRDVETGLTVKGVPAK